MFALLACTWPPPVRAQAADALWRIVHGQCVPGQLAHHSPQPCALVDTAQGYAILKDRRGASQFLLLATDKVTGIEDPAVLAPQAPAYWQAAWAARHFVSDALGRPLQPADVSLAINSVFGRSQNQLHIHIHIDCVAPEVRAALLAHGGNIGGEWAPLPMLLAGHEYRARRVAGLGQPGMDPFRLVNQDLGRAPGAMGGVSVFVVGAPEAGAAQGFFVLATRSDRLHGNFAAAEELQDHDCAIAR